MVSLSWRANDLPAVDAHHDLLAQEQKRVAEHNRYARDLYHVVRNTLPAPMFRGQLLDQKGLRFGRESARQMEKLSADRKSREQLDRSISIRARKMNISVLSIKRTPTTPEGLDELAAVEAKVDKKIEGSK